MASQKPGRKRVTAEALLRQRLSLAQRTDLDKTGTFCVVGSNTVRYRICVTDGPNGAWCCWNDMRFVIDGSGYARNFWFFERGLAVTEPYARALAAMTLLQANAMGFENYACREDVVERNWHPVHYAELAKTKARKAAA